MSDEFAFEGLTLSARRVGAGLTDAEQASRTPVEAAPGYLEFGVVIDGVFVAITAKKAGDIDQALAEAREKAARQPAQPAEPEPSSSGDGSGEPTGLQPGASDDQPPAGQ